MRDADHHDPIDTITAALGALGERYEIEREIGRGGMAVVVLARERRSGRRVAIKLISARYSGDAEAVHRFAREARTAASLQHPNIVRTLAIEELGAGDALAIVSAYVPGETLRDTLRSRGALAFDRTASVLRDVAAALAHAHEMRIVHRDVKPENIFLVGEPGRALLTDFGIARELDSDTLLTVEGSAIGTPTYMSPEQVDGLPVDERTDVYSLGLVGWEMLTGERPWQGETLYAVLHKQKHERLPELAELRPDIPAYLLTAIEGAIEKDPARRWQSASELLQRLSPSPARLRTAPVDADAGGDAWEDASEWAADASAETIRVARQPPAPRSGRAARAAWALGLILVAATGLLLLNLLSDRGGTTAASATPDSSPAEELARADGPTEDDVPRDSMEGAPPTDERTSAGEVAPSVADPSVVAPSATEPRTAAPPSRGGTGGAASTPAPRRAAVPRTINARCASPTAADQRACLLALIERQDVALDRSYQALIAELRREAGGEREPAAVRALRAEQRAWLVTRDSSCRAEAGELGGSWAVLLAPCFERQSALRDAELRARLGRLRAG